MSTAHASRWQKPQRPLLTPLFSCGIAFWAACALSYSAMRESSSATSLGLALVFIIALVASVSLLAAFRKTRLCFLAASFCLGASLGFGAAASCHALAGVASGQAFQDVEIELVGDSRSSSMGEAAFAKARLPDGSTAIVYALFDDDRPYLSGASFTVSGEFAEASGASGDYLWQNGAIGKLRVRTKAPVHDDSPLALLRAIREGAIQAIGSDDDARCLLQALVCGYRHNITATSLYASFQTCGLAHLVAVSGAHLVIVTSLAATLLRALKTPRRLSIAMLTAIMACYLVVAGMPVSAIRAAIMSSVGLLSIFGKRRPSALNALGLGMFAIVGTSPTAAVSASFALSALSTAGICLFGRLLQHWLDSTPLAKAPLIAETLSLTLAASLLSMPYACSLFHLLPLASPVANIVCAPLFPVVCAFGLLAAIMGVAAAPFAPIVMQATAGLSLLLSHIAEMLAALPFSAVPFTLSTPIALAGTFAVSLALWMTWPSMSAKKAAIGVFAVLVCLAGAVIPTQMEDALIMLDVGQGDAILVRSQGQTLLVDTGNRDSQLLDQLARCGAFRIGSVLVTHSDDDHCGSLDALRKGVHVDRALVSHQLLTADDEKDAAVLEQAQMTARSVIGLQYGSTFEIGRFTAQVVGPRSAKGDANADSLCLLLSYDGDADGTIDFTTLLTGDAETEELEQMLEHHDISHVDILKVGHHGSKKSLTYDQALAMGPRIALVSVGAQNRYGHPAPETLDVLESAGCHVYRTDRDGQVKCTLSPDSIAVRLQ